MKEREAQRIQKCGETRSMMPFAITTERRSDASAASVWRAPCLGGTLILLRLCLCLCLSLAPIRIADASRPTLAAIRPDGPVEHECQLFGYVFADGAGDQAVLGTLCANLYNQTLPAGFLSGQDPSGPAFVVASGHQERPSPSRDGWGFGYYLAPPHPGIRQPILIKGGPPACEDDARWNAAVAEITTFGLGRASVVLGHVRKSSYGPDRGALPDPHPFADSLMGRWWLFEHNGHVLPDTALGWIPSEFLARHPLDYDEVYVDSEVLFRYCQYEIERLGSVRAGLLFALHRVKLQHDFVFNLCLTDGDTLWTAHTLSYTPFYYGATDDSTTWWASTVRPGSLQSSMTTDHLYWFTAGAMGEASYE